MSGVVLASTSAIRRKLLEAAGIPVVVEPPRVDEAALKTVLKAGGADATAVAFALAEEKAAHIAALPPDRLVVAADQMLECEGAWFDKPVDRQMAQEQLRALRGKAHRLITAVIVGRDGRTVWRYVESARLVMRPFSEAFLESYLERVGDAAHSSVGGYQIEGLGVQLFSKIDGDHFAILGLPLLPLLSFLRTQGVVGT